jgi:hypothetical protein
MTDVASFRLLSLITALGALCGCSELDNCPDSKDPITIDTGKSDAATLVYVSASDKALDRFPAKTELIFRHDLGVTPASVQAFLAFSKDGTADGGPGSYSPAAGNEALVTCKDAFVIRIKNDTCENSFFIKVVATDADPFDDGKNDEKCSE